MRSINRTETHLELVEVAYARQAPVHVLHHGHKHELLAEEVHVARPVLHLAVRLLAKIKKEEKRESKLDSRNYEKGGRVGYILDGK